MLQLQLPATGGKCCTCRYPATRLSCLSGCALKCPTNYDMLCRVFEQLSALPFAVCGNSVRLQSRNFLISWTTSCCSLSTCPTARGRQAGGNPPKKATISQHANIMRPFALCHIKQTMRDLANIFEQLVIASLLYPAPIPNVV